MGKILGSWGGMRKYLETEMLAAPLRGRIRYSCTAYVGMDGSRIFEICVDGSTVKQFSMETAAKSFWAEDSAKTMSFWSLYWYMKDHAPLSQRSEFDDMEFAEALAEYRSLDISKALSDENPMVRMFAILDRRVGKRTLEKLVESVPSQPSWLQYFYALRMNAENIPFRKPGLS